MRITAYRQRCIRVDHQMNVAPLNQLRTTDIGLRFSHSVQAVLWQFKQTREIYNTAIQQKLATSNTGIVQKKKKREQIN